MSTPQDEVEHSKSLATAALERAETLAERGRRIADGWRQSRLDNNYRAMLRNLVAVNGEDQ